MKKLSDYPYDAALNEIELIINRVIKESGQLSELKAIVENARQRKTVPIRGIHEKLMEYRKTSGTQNLLNENERKVLRDIMDLWG